MQVCSAAGIPQICPLYTAPEASTALVTSPRAPESGIPVLVQVVPSDDTANSPGACHDAYRMPSVEMAIDGSFPSSDPGRKPVVNWNADPDAGATRNATRTAPSSAVPSTAILFMSITSP